MGVIVDGCPPGIEITEEEIQVELDRRKPGQSKITTPRKDFHFLMVPLPRITLWVFITLGVEAIKTSGKGFTICRVTNKDFKTDSTVKDFG